MIHLKFEEKNIYTLYIWPFQETFHEGSTVIVEFCGTMQRITVRNDGYHFWGGQSNACGEPM